MRLKKSVCKVIVEIDKKRKTVTVNQNATVSDLILKAGFTPAEIIVLKDNQPLPTDTKIKNDDCVKFVRVISGG
jgi:sulfur carrier protein ThiS